MARAPIAPVIPALVGSLPDRMRQLADAISRKADVTSEPVYTSVVLIAPGGAAWRLAVDDTGAVSTTVVTR